MIQRFHSCGHGAVNSPCGSPSSRPTSGHGWSPRRFRALQSMRCHVGFVDAEELGQNLAVIRCREVGVGRVVIGSDGACRSAGCVRCHDTAVTFGPLHPVAAPVRGSSSAGQRRRGSGREGASVLFAPTGQGLPRRRHDPRRRNVRAANGRLALQVPSAVVRPMWSGDTARW